MPDEPAPAASAPPGELAAGVAAVADEAASRKKVLLSGDAEGNLVKLFTQAANQQKRLGKFDALLSVGAFLPGMGAKEGAAALAQYVTGKEKVPIATYFIESGSAAMLQAAPEGKMLCENLHFLGGFGVREIEGLTVAYLSGRYDAKVYGSQDAGDAGPAFVGTSYTRQAIDGLLQLARKPGAPAIDVLLTAEWPMNIEDKLDEVERPKHPEDPKYDFKEVSSPVIAELCAALEPRYHVFGTGDIFYQRSPFQTLKSGHVSRCIGLGKVGSKGKARMWVHALSLSPVSTMTEAARMQRPVNTSACPFVEKLATPAGGASGEKRDADEMEALGEDGLPPPIPNEVFIGRLPPNIAEERLKKALKHCGTIERIHLAREEGPDGTKPCKGYGWVTFSTPDEAEAACELNDLLECGNRKLSIQISRPKAGGPPRKKRQVEIVIEPHSECWFCLVNPKVAKHMIVAATTEVYVATSRGPLTPAHVMVMPVKHAPCYAACPPDLQEALSSHVAAIRQMCRKTKQECIVWERWLPFGHSMNNHMQIQVLPIETSRAGAAREALEATVKRHLVGAVLKRVTSHAEVAEHLNDDTTTPYAYFEVPGDNTAKGRQIERYVYAGTTKESPRIPLNFGRMVACQLLNCEDKVDWRQCQEDQDTEKQKAVAFREVFKPFQPKS
jgi:diadenosine tetraphosphate (Ap4A) HIT family hydrolase